MSSTETGFSTDMDHGVTEKYAIKNVDCANCAAKIEAGLRRMDGVEYASLDFANLLLHVKMKDSSRLTSYIHTIEPDVEVVPYAARTRGDTSDEALDSFPIRRELVNLITAAVIFTSLIFFETWLQRNVNFVVLIALVMAAYLLVGWNVIIGALRTIRRGALFDENVLMVIATGGAIAIGAYAESHRCHAFL